MLVKIYPGQEQKLNSEPMLCQITNDTTDTNIHNCVCEIDRQIDRAKLYIYIHIIYITVYILYIYVLYITSRGQVMIPKPTETIYTNSVQLSFANNGLNSDLFTLVVCIATICIYTVYGMGNQMSTGYCHKSHVNNLGSMFLNHCLCFPRGSITSQ